MSKSYKSEAFAAIHETMEVLHEINAIDKETMRSFDTSCITKVDDMLPEEIKALREREHLSQPIFALYLNVSKGLISSWERGTKKPSGAALKLLSIVQNKGIEAII